MAFRRVVDARGVDRRVYNLRARWRSARMRREFPRPLYEAICAAVRGRDNEGHRPSAVAELDGSQLFSRSSALLWLVGAVLGFGMLVERIGTRPIGYLSVAFPVVALGLGLLHLFGRRLPWLWRARNLSSVRLTSPLEWVDDGQMAAAMVVNGRCPSCAYPVDPARREADGAVVCAECGGAWVVVRRGGELRLGR